MKVNQMNDIVFAIGFAKGTRGYDYTNDYAKRLQYEQDRADSELAELQSALTYFQDRFAQ